MTNTTNVYSEKLLEERLTKFYWVIKIRWVFLTFILIGGFLFFQKIPLSLFKYLLNLIFLSFLLNLFYWASIKVFLKNQWLVGSCTFISILIDAFFIELFLYANGLAGQISGLIFTIPIIVGGIVFTLKTSLGLTIIISVGHYIFSYLSWRAGLVPGYFFQNLEPIFYFFMTAYFVGYLADLTRNSNHLLWQAEAKIMEKNQQIYATSGELIKAEKLAAITEMCVNLDEEINGPLTIILGMFFHLKDRLKKENLMPAGILEILEIIIGEVKKIEATMQNINKLIEGK